MAKRFMCVSIGVFLLVAAFELGASRVRAEYNPGTQGLVAAFAAIGSGGRAYGASGEAWSVQVGAPWTRQPQLDLPVPLGEVKFLDENAFVTQSDVVWGFNTGTQTWEDLGSFPGGPVTLEQESWGRVKAKHR